MNTTSVLPRFRSGRALVLVRLYSIGVLLGALALPQIGAVAGAALDAPAVERAITPLMLFVVLVFAPVAEECIYRWLPFLLFDQSPRLAILVGALAFGAMHWVSHPASGVVAFAAGLLLGWVYSRSRIIWDAVALHAGINAGAIGLAALLGTGVA